MTREDKRAHEAAMQYLVWALEEIEKTGSKEAAEHAGRAVDALREASKRADLAAK